MLEHKIAISTVLYNSSRHLEGFAQALIANKDAIARVVFVDNHSSDEYAPILQSLNGLLDYSVIKNNENVGYAHAMNQGLKEIYSEGYTYIMATNNDIHIKEGGLSLLLEDTNVSYADVVGVPTTNDGAHYRVSCHYDKASDTFIPDPLITTEELSLRAGKEKVVESAYVQGGIILFNRSFFEAIGFYDDYLFFGGDESDFLIRIKRSTKKIKSIISLRSFAYFDHYSSHDNRFKLLKAKMIVRGETYVLMKHGYSIFSSLFLRKVKSLMSELGGKSIARYGVLSVLLVRAVISNYMYLSSKKRLNKRV